MALEFFDLIVLDVSIPVMDGLDFLNALKQRLEKEAKIVPRIVMLTSSPDPKDRLQAEQFPVQGYLSEGKVSYLCSLSQEKA